MLYISMVPTKATQEWQKQRGITFNPNGNQDVSYEWGLGVVSNNQAKALVLSQGIKILDSRRIKNIIIVGDSSIIIKLMSKMNTPSNGKLRRLIARIQNEASHSKTMQYYHVLRDNNRQANDLTNTMSRLDCGSSKNKINRGPSLFPIP
jgi:ribonuclease HI